MNKTEPKVAPIKNLTKRKCTFCLGPLRAIGLDRKNGKGSYNDWNSREMHKQCLKEDIKQEKYKLQYGC